MGSTYLPTYPLCYRIIKVVTIYHVLYPLSVPLISCINVTSPWGASTALMDNLQSLGFLLPFSSTAQWYILWGETEIDSDSESCLFHFLNSGYRFWAPIHNIGTTSLYPQASQQYVGLYWRLLSVCKYEGKLYMYCENLGFISRKYAKYTILTIG